MALKIRIIPVLLWSDHGLVKPVKFERPGRFVGSLMSAALIFEKRTCDELILLDIAATPKKMGPRFAEISQFTSALFCPVAVGGGITTISDIRDMLAAGADKVVLQTRADADFIREAAKKFGSQAIVIAVNYRSHEGWVLPELVKGYAAAGAGEIILTCMDRDGTRTGYDLDNIRLVAREVKIPVIANGGCSGPSNMREALSAGAHAVAASTIFLYSDITPEDCKAYLAKYGVPVRIEEADLPADSISAWGEVKTVVAWSRDPRCVIALETLRSRVRRGIKPEIALSTKVLNERNLA